MVSAMHKNTQLVTGLETNVSICLSLNGNILHGILQISYVTGSLARSKKRKSYQNKKNGFFYKILHFVYYVFIIWVQRYKDILNWQNIFVFFLITNKKCGP